jgi:hypothetical protein
MARKRVADMTPEELERERARKRTAGRKENMTPEQLERERARGRTRARKGMTPEQVERKRARGRLENMAPEEVEIRYARDAETNAKRAPDLEIHMLRKIDMATRLTKCTYRIPSICPPELAAKLAPVLEMLKTADAAQRAAIRGVVRTMRAARELELIEDGGTMPE